MIGAISDVVSRGVSAADDVGVLNYNSQKLRRTCKKYLGIIGKTYSTSDYMGYAQYFAHFGHNGRNLRIAQLWPSKSLPNSRILILES
jgi:hypothetical protein